MVRKVFTCDICGEEVDFNKWEDLDRYFIKTGAAPIPFECHYKKPGGDVLTSEDDIPECFEICPSCYKDVRHYITKLQNKSLKSLVDKMRKTVEEYDKEDPSH